MTGHLNPLSTVIENKCGASLAILTHNPITVLTEPTGPFSLFQPLTLLLLLCLSPWLSSEQRGVPKLIDPMFLTHTIQLSWTLVPFKPPSWNPLFCVPDAVRHIQMSTWRCRHGDVGRAKATKCLSIITGLSKGLFSSMLSPHS